jgi:hypothetical protein
MDSVVLAAGPIQLGNLVHPWAEIRAGHAPDRDTVDMCWPVIIAALNDLAATAP